MDGLLVRILKLIDSRKKSSLGK